jgi:subtilisin family serine protease
MNRNNFLPHVALAVVIILIAAFAGQVRKWQKEWPRHHQRVATTPVDPYVIPDRATSDPGQVVRGTEVLVRFRAGVSEEKIQSITRRLHDRVADEIESVSGLEVIEDEDGQEATAVAAEYQALKDEVEYAEPNFKIQIDPIRETNPGESELGPTGNKPNDPMFSDQWALANNGQHGGKTGADISAIRAWVKTTGSDDVVVAVLDSGVDYTHPDLAKNIWIRPANIQAYKDRDCGEVDDVRGYNAIDNDNDPMDENGHGTHCAGIIGAEGGNNEGIAGVNWKVQIMPLKFMDANGSGTTKDAIEAINYVIDRQQRGVNVRIISASWGSTQKSRALEDVIREVYRAGILFVAASGNSSVDTDQSPHYPSSYNVANIISVAATDANDELTVFSNYGRKTVQIAAPGKDILSTWLENGFREASGTSMATPVVAGVAALVLSKDPHMAVDELRRHLLNSVDKLPRLQGKVVTGGRINAARAVGAE